MHKVNNASTLCIHSVDKVNTMFDKKVKKVVLSCKVSPDTKKQVESIASDNKVTSSSVSEAFILSGLKHYFKNEKAEKKDSANEVNKERNAKEEPLNKRKDIYTEQARECLDYLNEKSGRQFKSTKELIPRLKEYSVSDVKLVIDVKVREWLHDHNMNKYIRPETLFNKTKFEGYLNAEKFKPVTKQEEEQQDIEDWINSSDSDYIDGETV